MSKQPEALRLADLLEDWAKDYATTDFDCDMGDQAAAELRRLHAVNAELLESLKSIAGQSMSMYGSYVYMIEKLQDTASAAIAKAQGESNE